MAFRADEAARAGLEEALSYFLPRSRETDESARTRSRNVLLDILDECGPVIGAYPSWHPLVCNYADDRNPQTLPSTSCGYRGLDHTRFFANGFITCPYGNGGQDVIDSVNALPFSHIARITAEKLDVKLYSPEATPIWVKCQWERQLESDGTIPISLAVPLILEKELPCWQWSQVAETWETMRPYLLGKPHGSRSSLFVSQETGQGIRKIWDSLIYTGMFGPIRV